MYLIFCFKHFKLFGSIGVKLNPLEGRNDLEAPKDDNHIKKITSSEGSESAFKRVSNMSFRKDNTCFSKKMKLKYFS